MEQVLRGKLLKSILDDLSYLSIQGHELIIESQSEIGAGGGGEVLSAKLCKLGESEMHVAVKCVWRMGMLSDRQRFVVRFARELKVWASIRHGNILPLVGFYLSDSNDVARLVSPFMANGNVTQYISRVSPELPKRWSLVEDITAGVEFLHNHQPPICHGDLKPGNVLISDELEAILCDFGLASLVETPGTPSGLTTSHSVKGSSRYMSPELLLEPDVKHTLPSDVWAWACTSFEILTDRIPYFQEKREPQMIIAMHNKQAPGDAGWLTEKMKYSSNMQSLLSRCWSYAPHLRPTMRGIFAELFPILYLESEPGAFGYVSARIKASLDGKCGSVTLRQIMSTHESRLSFSSGDYDVRDPRVCVKLNGACQGAPCYNTCQGSLLPKTGPADFDANVDFIVRNLREVIVLEVTCLDRFGFKKRVLGRVAIGVRELARVDSVSGQHDYAIQGTKRNLKITMEYDVKFFRGERFTDLRDHIDGRGQPGIPITGGRFTQQWSDRDPTRSTSSGATTFYSARSHFSDFQMSIPGAFSDFDRSV